MLRNIAGLAILFAGLTSGLAAQGLISTIAGNGSLATTGDGGQASAAAVNSPFDVVVDKNGNIYIAESGGNRIRKIAVDGTITTVAGNGTQGFSGDGGLATAAALNQPRGVAVDAAGNIYIGDRTNNRIRKVTVSTGVISTIAGNGTTAFNGDGIAALSSGLNVPVGVAVDAAGNVYIADQGNFRVRKVDAAGIISTFAGTGVSGFTGDGGQAASAQIGVASAVIVDANGVVYFNDLSSHRIRKVTATGLISTLTGSGVAGISADGIVALGAAVSTPAFLALDKNGNLLFSESNNQKIRRINGDGTLSTVAGTGTAGFSGDGGLSTAALLNNPRGVFVDASGNTYIGDSTNNRVRKIAAACSYTLSASSVSVIAGGGTGSFNVIAAAGCTWTATTTSSFVTITSGASGSGSGVVNFSLSANATTTARSATITVADQTFTITQAAPAATCSYGLSSSGTSLDSSGGSGTVSVTAGAGCTWTASSGASFVTITSGASGSGNGTVGYSVAANTSTTTRIATLNIAALTFTVSQSGQAAASVPTFTANGVTNGASFLAGATPGGIVTIFGVNLSRVTGIIGADKVPLPTNLQGTSVTIAGASAPLFAVVNVNGNEQINLQVPYEMTGRSNADIIVTNNGVSNAPINVTILAAQPGVFAYAGDQAVVLHGVSNQLIGINSPAAKGEVVVIYATGLGPVSPAPATGAAAGLGTQLAMTSTTPTVTVGGKSAVVQFSGLTPGFVALNQINVVIPTDAVVDPVLGTADLVMSISGQSSKSLKLAVK